MSKLPIVLLVEDSAAIARAVDRALRDTASVECTSSVVEAIDYLDQHEPPLLIVDAKLPDGCGLDVVTHGRALDPQIPALAMSGDRSFVNRAYSLGVMFVLKPVEAKCFVDFVQGARRDKGLAQEGVMPALNAWSKRHELTPSEHEILVAFAVNAIPRKKLARVLRKSEATVKTHTRNLLSKTDHNNLDGVSATILRDALKRG